MDLESLTRWLLSRPLYLKVLFFVAAVAVAVAFGHLGIIVGNTHYQRRADRKEGR